jgi:DNA-binding HxlR family transcriptional regulator
VDSELKPKMLAGVRPCPVADALEVVGDRWSLLVLRELGFGVRRFNDIKRHTGAPTDRLAARLRDLEADGIIRRHLYSEHPPRYEYLLTDAGRALAPVIQQIAAWGEQYAPLRTRDPGATPSAPPAPPEIG